MFARCSFLSAIACLISYPAIAFGVEVNDEIIFNDAFLRGKEKIDVSRFSRGNPVEPGSYVVDVYVNDIKVKSGEVTFLPVEGRRDAQPCFLRAEFISMGFAVDRLDAEQLALFSSDTTCVRVETLWPEAAGEYDSGMFRLDLRVPQAALVKTARGYVNPQLWDEGALVGFVNYNITSYHLSGDSSLRSDFASFNSGLNLGLQQLRSQVTYSGNSEGTSDWQNVRTYLQRSLPRIEGRLVAGQSFTSGRYFDTVGFTGVEVASDERMMPDSRRGYAPVVRGIARTQARVTVQQNNFVLYETTVPPGPFELDDLYPTGFGGDLRVTITESDGSEQSYAIPFSAVPDMLREDTSRYAIAGGKLRDTAIEDGPYFTQLSYARGMSNLLTLYGAGQLSEDYYAGLFGAGINTSWGAISADITGAYASLNNEGNRQGWRLKLGHNYRFTATETYFSLAAYRYDSRHFLTLRDAAFLNQQNGAGENLSGSLQKEKDRIDLIINQPLKQYGQLFMTLSTRTGWDDSGRQTEVQAGYSGVFRSFNYTINISRTESPEQSAQTRFFAGITIPLESVSKYHMTSMTSISGGDGNHAFQTSVNGSGQEDSSLSFGFQAGYDSGFAQSSWGGNIQKQFSKMNVYGSASRTGSYKQFSAGVSGSVVMHDKGVIFGQVLGESFAIVEAPGAMGARLSSHENITVDRYGYAIVPYLTPFRMNTVSLSPMGMDEDVELKETSQIIAPYSGAGVKLRFETLRGRSVLIALRQPSGQLIPVGADVYDEENNILGVVGQGSRAYIRSAREQGTVTIRWGDLVHQQCAVRYSLPEKKASDVMTTISAVCYPVSLAAR